jgi:hypothetical protein
LPDPIIDRQEQQEGLPLTVLRTGSAFCGGSREPILGVQWKMQ